MAATSRQRLARWGAAALTVGLVAGACTSADGPSLAGPIGQRPTVDLSDAVLASLTRLESCAETASQMRGAAVAAVEAGTLTGFGGGEWFSAVGGPVAALADDVAAEFEAGPGEDGAATTGGASRGSGDTANAPAAPTDAEESPGAEVFSTTNVQEAGVDEPDIVKTDGSSLFILRESTVRVLDASTLEEVAAIEVGDATAGSWPSDLLLDDDVLVVVGQTDGEIGIAESSRRQAAPVRWQPRTVLTRYDVSDPASPSLVDSTVVDGHVVSSRLIGGVARVVTSDPGAGGIDVPVLDDGEDWDAYTDRVVDAIAEAPAEDFLPSYTVLDDTGAVVDEGAAVACDQVYVPTYETGPSTLTVHTLDLDGSFSPGDGVSVLAGGETVYASQDTLYVATSRFSPGTRMFFGGVDDVAMFIDEVGAPAAPPELVDPPLVGPGDDGDIREIEVEFPDGVEVSDPVEPEPAQPIAPPEPPTVTTEVHAFSIGGADAAGYLGSGQVVGTVLNQFSMSEHEGVLRIATTDEGWGGPESQSYVTTMRRSGDELVQVGQVGGLGRGERIYAVRFLGTTGYVVTFRQVDPLYTIDLSDPASPRVLGELKITGYSAYLHPTAPGRLLGLGQEATEQGRRLGTQMSLFDVSDLTSPSRLSQVLFGQGSDSAAEYDHHAFLWWDPADLVVVPIQSWGGFDERGARSEAFSGVVLVRNTGDRLSEVARISHTPGGSGGEGDDLVYRAGIERSLVIGDRLVTISSLGVAAHDLDTFEEVAIHRFPDTEPRDVPFGEPIPVEPDGGDGSTR